MQVNTASEVIAIKVQQKAWGKLRASEVTFDRTHFVSSGSWMHALLCHAAMKSQASPLEVGRWTSVRFVLQKIAGWMEWHRVAAIPPSNLKAADLTVFYRALDTFVTAGEVSSSQLSMLARFRTAIKEYLVVELRLESCRPLYSPYKSELRARRVGRGTISDMVDKGSSVPEPIGALNHSTLDDLKYRSIQKRQQSVKRLKAAIASDIELYKTRLRWIEDLRRIEFTEEDKDQLVRLYGRRSDVITPRLAAIIERYDARTRLSFALKLASQLDPEVLKQRRPFNFIGHLVGFETIKTHLGGHARKFWHVFYYEVLGESFLIHAYILSLQLLTGWNVSSVMELEAADIRRLPNGLMIQSVKAKTDDDTPPVFIDSGEVDAIFLVEFMLRRHEMMLTLGIVKDARIVAGSFYRGRDVPVIHKMKLAFQARHGLPAYSWEQVRNEVLALVHSTRGTEAARQVAGHADYSVIGTYVDDEASRALNSSINLEFMRRVQRDITTFFDHPEGTVWPSLTPTGDGSSCLNPSLPPKEVWLDNERCRAEHCHAGEGCPNRRILIDTDRLREVAFTLSYYRKSSERLISENQARYFAMHWPRALTAKAIELAMLAGPYAAMMVSATNEAVNDFGTPPYAT